MTNKKIYWRCSLPLLLVFSFLIGLIPQGSEAGSISGNGCDVHYSSPTQVAYHLDAKATVRCSNGLYLPHFKVCIRKHRRFRPDQQLACSGGFFGNSMAGYIRETTDTVRVRCQGKGTYFTEVSWHTIGSKDFINVIQMINNGSVWTGGILKAIKIGGTGNNRHQSEYVMRC